MTRKEAIELERRINRLQEAGISRPDAEQLRRISMTLRRWHELECGDSDDWKSWAIERDEQTGKPYMHISFHSDMHGRSRYEPLPDRENGAKKRLAAIMAKYPHLQAYIQGDPRGAALYILRPGDVPEGEQPDSYYTRGMVIY